MSNTIEQIIVANIKDPSVLVYVGAGSCTELKTFKSINPTKIILVEGNPDLTLKLQKEAERNSGLEVINKVIAKEDGIEKFYIASNKKLSGLKGTIDLIDYYPNIKIIEEKTVKAMSIESLINKLNLEDMENHLLILDLNGAERLVLSGASLQSLLKFKWIIIRSNEYVFSRITEVRYALEEKLGSVYCEYNVKEDISSSIISLFIRNDRLAELEKEKKIVEQQLELVTAKEEVSKIALHNTEKKQNDTVKLLKKERIDNINLRVSYKGKVEREQELLELIMELRNSLEIASQYYNNLQKAHPELLHEFKGVK